MTSETYRTLAAAMRANPPVIDRRLSGEIDAAIADAVGKIDGDANAGAFVAELVHIASLSVVQVVEAAHGGVPCGACLLRASYQFDRTIQEVMAAWAKGYSGKTN